MGSGAMVAGQNSEQGDKIKSGYITPPFSRAQKWAELLRNPCVLGGRQTRGQLKGPGGGGGTSRPNRGVGSPVPPPKKLPQAVCMCVLAHVCVCVCVRRGGMPY